jgi:hypothetical protein
MRLRTGLRLLTYGQKEEGRRKKEKEEGKEEARLFLLPFSFSLFPFSFG